MIITAKLNVFWASTVRFGASMTTLWLKIYYRFSKFRNESCLSIQRTTSNISLALCSVQISNEVYLCRVKKTTGSSQCPVVASHNSTYCSTLGHYFLIQRDTVI